MRNYVECWGGRVVQGGNFIGAIRATEQECKDELQVYIDNLGYSWFEKPFKMYFLANKANICGVLHNFALHYSGILNVNWTFFQDGRKALESPRDTWSHGE